MTIINGMLFYNKFSLVRLIRKHKHLDGSLRVLQRNAYHQKRSHLYELIFLHSCTNFISKLPDEILVI